MPCNCRNNTSSAMCYHNADWSLLGRYINSSIDLPKLQTWNIQQSHEEVATILDPNTKEDPTPADSDADEEILMTVQFGSFVRIKGISITGPGDSASPARVLLFSNRTDITGFDAARRHKHDVELMLPNSARGEELIHKLDPVKFPNVSTMTLLFDQNWGNDETQLVRIEFFGEDSGNLVNRRLATNVVYESRANPADHPAVDEDQKHGANIIS